VRSGVERERRQRSIDDARAFRTRVGKLTRDIACKNLIARLFRQIRRNVRFRKCSSVPVTELENAMNDAFADPSFWREYTTCCTISRRPSPVYAAKRLAGPNAATLLFLSRRSQPHRCAQSTNTVGARLLARRMGKTRFIAGPAPPTCVATATVARSSACRSKCSWRGRRGRQASTSMS